MQMRGTKTRTCNRPGWQKGMQVRIRHSGIHPTPGWGYRILQDKNSQISSSMNEIAVTSRTGQKMELGLDGEALRRSCGCCHGCITRRVRVNESRPKLPLKRCVRTCELV